ncbi:DEAD/DEAH box helicase [Pseudonocardia sp. S2-4]|uniref:DEAD/DEAH box helicase n=2 Tax=Pseudonocardia humida TaxID=2800819 RepID=A0ABT0ZYF1_9PSEU|nr:DEAD/DEAH box helicase [Pseudonocardia humida]
MEWDDAGDTLYAEVRGLDGECHEVEVSFRRGAGGRLVFLGGECTCPTGIDCAHVVAAAVTLAQAPRRPAQAAKREDAWVRELDALLAPDEPGYRPAAGTVPVAIELSVRSGSGRGGDPASLSARLVRPGRTGWVAGGLSWGRIGQPYQADEYRPEHVRLLSELYAVYRSTDQQSRYYYAPEDRSIDLDRFDSTRLWALLEEADEIGLQIVHSRKRLGQVEHRRRAELRLDVTATDDGGLQVAPALHLDPTGPGRAEAPLLLIGESGHGVVHTPVGPDGAVDPTSRGFGLARLTTPAPPGLRRMVLDGRRLPVPHGQLERFRTEFCPRLSRLAPICSSDGAFEPPRTSEPTLVLRAAFGDGHELGLDWVWSYDVGGAPVRTPVDPPAADDALRDRVAERAVLDAVRDLGVEVPGLDTGSGRSAHTELRGLDTMRFATEALPRLVDVPRLVVEEEGEPPRYREAGESLQVGVRTEAVAGDNDWFDLGVRVSVEGREVPFAELFVALAAGESHLLLDDGAYFALDKPELQALRALIEEARSLQDAPGGLRISRFQAGLWEELAALGVVEQQARAWREQVGGLLALGEVGGAEPPATLTAQLRPYQREGYEWLCFLWRHGLGGILADDMGLGKTLQTLALVGHARQVAPEAPPFLVVAPSSVVAVWAAEARRFAPDLAVVTITDTLRRSGRQLADVVAGADVVVTSYALFRLDIEAHEGVRWSGLVLDEAQFAKNHQSKVHQCARRLPAPFKLAITGTPMENNLMELWSLLSITAPGLFPSPTRFRDSYARPIEKGAEGAPELLARLRRRIRPLVRRRTKEQVARELPAKQEQVLEVELDPRHRRLYQRHLQRERQKVLGLLDDVDRNRFTILKSITLLRRLSLHPALVEPEQGHLGSAKIDALLEQLGEVVGSGHRALVFSQFTGFLAEVRQRLDAAGITYAYLDGSSRDRPAIVRRFTDGAAPVFLISLKAGGFGLTLTEADYCFLLDPWWNPATEAQAVDRTHRIGQTRAVMVYRLIARDTIEEKVRALALRKAALFSGVMDEGNAFGAALEADDIRALVS